MAVSTLAARPCDASAQAYPTLNLESQWAQRHALLSERLRSLWIRHSGRVRTTVTDPEAINLKLRSSLVFDRQLFRRIRQALFRPTITGPDAIEELDTILSTLSARFGGRLPK